MEKIQALFLLVLKSSNFIHGTVFRTPQSDSKQKMNLILYDIQNLFTLFF